MVGQKEKERLMKWKPGFWEMFFVVIGLLVLALIFFILFTSVGFCDPIFGIEPIDDLLTMFCRR